MKLKVVSDREALCHLSIAMRHMLAGGYKIKACRISEAARSKLPQEYLNRYDNLFSQYAPRHKAYYDLHSQNYNAKVIDQRKTDKSNVARAVDKAAPMPIARPVTEAIVKVRVKEPFGPLDPAVPARVEVAMPAVSFSDDDTSDSGRFDAANANGPEAERLKKQKEMLALMETIPGVREGLTGGFDKNRAVMSSGDIERSKKLISKIHDRFVKSSDSGRFVATDRELAFSEKKKKETIAKFGEGAVKH